MTTDEIRSRLKRIRELVGVVSDDAEAALGSVQTGGVRSDAELRSAAEWLRVANKALLMAAVHLRGGAV